MSEKNPYDKILKGYDDLIDEYDQAISEMDAVLWCGYGILGVLCVGAVGCWVWSML